MLRVGKLVRRASANSRSRNAPSPSGVNLLKSGMMSAGAMSSSKQLKRDNDCRSPKPPLCAGPFDQFQHQHEQRIAEHSGEQQTLSDDPASTSSLCGVEPESLFDFELRVPVEGQSGNAQRDPRRKRKPAIAQIEVPNRANFPNAHGNTPLKSTAINTAASKTL